MRNKKTRFLSILLVLVMALTLITPALAAQSNPKDDSLKIAVLSDLHYISPDLIADTDDYTHALNMDRKMLTESDAIDTELLKAVKADKPDILLISGDLTKDGELENHQAISAKLQELQKDVPGLKIYVINGNHDIRNSNGQIFSTPDGNAIDATRTHPEDFKAIYDFVYSDETVIATYTPPEGKESGSLSYVARPCEGYTIIAIDTCRYSADNTDDKVDEHETSGAVSVELEQWVTEQITEAKSRGDLVIGLEHHGLVPHFSMEPTLMPMYLVENYDRISKEWADAGMELVFTGHMHALDISTLTTDAGNTIYDIETGSSVSYPSPVRNVCISKTASGDTNINVSSKIHFGPISYTEADGTSSYIEDITAKGQALGLSEKMLVTVASTYLGEFLDKYTFDDCLSNWVTDKILEKVRAIVSDLVNIPVADGSKTLLDAVNYFYQSHLSGNDNGIYPEWIQQSLAQIENGQILNEIIRVIKVNAFGTPAEEIKFDCLITRVVKAKLNGLILDIANSFGKDVNYAEDINTVITLKGEALPPVDVEALPPVDDEALPFTDVPRDYWAYEDIAFAYNNGLFNGTSADTFSPGKSMNRGMLVTVLWRMEGMPDAEASPFKDAKNIWCSDAIDWAYTNKIVNGFNSDCFAPNRNVTREQIAMILYRYAAYCGANVTGSSDISGFLDYGTVSKLAIPALSWANANGIIQGNGNCILPKDNASRAQVAAILHRFINTCL